MQSSMWVVPVLLSVSILICLASKNAVGDDQFIDDMVAVHNEFRSVHFPPPIQKSLTMSRSAKEFAGRLAAKKDLAQSSPNDRPGEGENLALGCTRGSDEAITAAEAVKKWHDEACLHDFSKNIFQDSSRHFTQLVWKATKTIGVGRAFAEQSGMNCTFIVARYSPKGNVDTEIQFRDNVERGMFDPVVFNCSAKYPLVVGEHENQHSDAVQSDV